MQSIDLLFVHSTIFRRLCFINTMVLLVYGPTTDKNRTQQRFVLKLYYRMSNKMLNESEYIQLGEIIDSSEMSSLLSARNSRRVSDNSSPENSLQKSIDETVERNPCIRIGLHQVRNNLLNSFLPLLYIANW